MQKPLATPVRVLYCESNTDGTVGGSHFCMLYLAAGLDRRRYQPMALFYADHSLVARFRQAHVDVVVRDIIRPYHIGWLQSDAARRHPWLFLPLTLLQRAVNFGGFLGEIRNNVRFLRRNSIGIVHLNNSILRHHHWIIAAMLTRTPILVHERGINQRYSAVARFLARRVEAVICMSKSIRDFMVAGGVTPDNLRVMYDGVDPQALKVTRPPEEVRRSFGIEPGQPVVGIVGNIREWKGQEIVIRAVGSLVKKYPSLVCLLIGATADADRHYEERIRVLIKEAALERNVRFTGYQAQVPELLNALDVAIHASILPEPFGMVVLEAMAMRKPMIGSGAGGVPEMVVQGVTGYTFPPGDFQTLARHLDELLGDPAKARAMGERGHQRVLDHFDVHKYVDDVQALYDQLVLRDGKSAQGGLAASSAP